MLVSWYTKMNDSLLKHAIIAFVRDSNIAIDKTAPVYVELHKLLQSVPSPSMQEQRRIVLMEDMQEDCFEEEEEEEEEDASTLFVRNLMQSMRLRDEECSHIDDDLECEEGHIHMECE